MLCCSVHNLTYYTQYYTHEKTCASSRLKAVSCKDKNAYTSSGLCNHYSELFTCTVALKFTNPVTKLPKLLSLSSTDLVATF